MCVGWVGANIVINNHLVHLLLSHGRRISQHHIFIIIIPTIVATNLIITMIFSTVIISFLFDIFIICVCCCCCFIINNIAFYIIIIIMFAIIIIVVQRYVMAVIAMPMRHCVIAVIDFAGPWTFLRHNGGDGGGAADGISSWMCIGHLGDCLPFIR